MSPNSGDIRAPDHDFWGLFLEKVGVSATDPLHGPRYQSRYETKHQQRDHPSIRVVPLPVARRSKEQEFYRGLQRSHADSTKGDEHRQVNTKLGDREEKLWVDAPAVSQSVLWRKPRQSAVSQNPRPQHPNPQTTEPRKDPRHWPMTRISRPEPFDCNGRFSYQPATTEEAGQEEAIEADALYQGHQPREQGRH